MTKTYELKKDTNPTKKDEVIEAGTEIKLKKIDFGIMSEMQEKTRKIVKEQEIDLNKGEIPAKVMKDIIKNCVIKPEKLKKDKYIERLSYPDIQGLFQKLSKISGIEQEDKKK